MPSAQGAFTGGIGFAMFFGILGFLFGAVLGGYWTWFNIPVVGGEWWFYIRSGTTIVGAIVGSKVGLLAGNVVGFGVGSIAGGLLS